MKTEKEIKQIVKQYRKPADAVVVTNGVIINIPVKQRRFGNYEIVNGKVNPKNHITIADTLVENGRLKLGFQHAYQFTVGAYSLTSLEGFPEFVSDSKYDNTLYTRYALRFCYDNAALTSFEGISKFIDGDLHCEKLTNVTYHNINKHITSIKGTIIINPRYTGPLLGFLLIQDLRYIAKPAVSTLSTAAKPELIEALKIVNKHLKSDRNVIDCQRELIQAGLKDFAKL